MKIIIQKGYQGRERTPFLFNSKYECVFLERSSPENINIPHIGSVEFCEQALGKQKPDFYPYWTESLWGRRINRLRYCSVVIGEAFVKNNESYKSGSLFVKGETRLEWNDVYVSEIVDIKNEYRHYFLNGKELCSWWYDGKNYNDSELHPNGLEIKCEVPADFCGTLDMAELDNGDYILIEAHCHPYAIGWYGDVNHNYEDFIVNGWTSIASIIQ